MSGWGGGYVTDIPYTTGWYRQQSPAMMALGSIIGGASAHIPTADDKINLLELGCGFGYAAMALAASNPKWSVTGVDFNPAHIAGAREWAAEAGLTNITFIEGDFTTWEDNPALRDLPEMDFVTMHGIWSWIPAAAQKGLVRLFGQKVRPGGLVHLSYNTLPGWQERMGAARVIREAGLRASGRSDSQAREGMRVLKELVAAKAFYTATGTSVSAMVERLENVNPHYLAHEFMNLHWSPCYAMDVAAALSEAKLEWAGSGNLTENFAELMMTEEQRAIANRYSDPMMLELIKDMCTARSLRHDVFVRGARRINLAQRAETLMDVSLTLVRRAEDLPESLMMPAGKAELNPEFYRPIVKSLSTRPGRVGDLLNLPDVSGRRDNPAELISILITADMVETTSRPMTDPGPEAIRFNAVSARRLSMSEPPNRPVAAACRPTGTPVTTPLLTLVLMNFMREGLTDVAGLVRALNTPPEQEEAARTSVEACLEHSIPVLKHAGVF